MNNIALVHVPSVTFSSEEFNGKTIYRGIDEYTKQVGDRIRLHLSEAGMECSPVRRSFKPDGNGFEARSASGRYIIIVCIEDSALPNAAITISADLLSRAVKNWESFEPFFRRGVESEFSECHPKWMTVDEYIKT